MTIKEIEKAIAEDRICLYIQPIYSVKENKFTSAEILARIIDEDGNIIKPNDFIPVAEKSQLMFSLEMKILQKVCEILVSDEIQSLELNYIEINLSAKNAEHRKFLEDAKSIIDENKIQHKTLNIEITESTFPQNESIFFENLRLLRENDFRISLDDFGTGASNLQYLLNIPAKIIKLDTSLIQSAFTNEKSIPIIHGMINIAHTIGSKVVAEGAEDEKTILLLKDLDVDYIQGFYFSKPLSVPDFIKFVKENNKSCSV